MNAFGLKEEICNKAAISRMGPSRLLSEFYLPIKHAMGRRTYLRNVMPFVSKEDVTHDIAVYVISKIGKFDEERSNVKRSNARSLLVWASNRCRKYRFNEKAKYHEMVRRTNNFDWSQAWTEYVMDSRIDEETLFDRFADDRMKNIVEIVENSGKFDRREKEIARLISMGYGFKDIVEKIGRPGRTVSKRIKTLANKLSAFKEYI